MVVDDRKPCLFPWVLVLRVHEGHPSSCRYGFPTRMSCTMLFKKHASAALCPIYYFLLFLLSQY
ncbi:hypothetical protein DFH06DRAFT_1343418 [Mycena polygramma]|nr:hypothetical protein DFH06DRAFT_1343418 [Mycena polygramma]